MDGFLPTFTRRNQHPPDFRNEIETVHTESMENPEKVVLALQDLCKDFIKRSKELEYTKYVKKGDKVLRGQKIGYIGTKTDNISVHASISGEVTEIGEIVHPLGWKVNGVTITSDYKDESLEPMPFKDSKLEDNRDGLLSFFREMGVPIDFSLPEKVSTVLVNATEFETTLTSKVRLIIEETKKIAEAIKILRLIYNPSRILFLVQEKHLKLIKLYTTIICSQVPDTELKVVADAYPVTLQALLRQRIDFERGRASVKREAVKETMIEPSVLIALYDAFYLGEPFTRQLVSVVGSGVKKPGNLWVRCGTTIEFFLKERCENPSSIGRVTFGGPMMGLPQSHVTTPLIKRITGVSIDVALVFNEERISRLYKSSTCIRCGKCADVCPVGLQPNLIAEYIRLDKYEEAATLGLFSCLECGLCYYGCPAIVPLIEILKKGKYRSIGIDNLLSFDYYKTFYN